MSTPSDTRSQVSRAYAQAITATASGCCGSKVKPGGGAARTAGYTEEQADSVPEEAYQSSFACGNPVAYSGILPGQTVLDLGSGGGLDLLLAAEKTGPTGRVIGVDMTDEMIDVAQRNIEAAGVGAFVEVRKGIIEELPVENASVDWVISNCVINLSPEKDKVFAEVHRVLKPGGRMLVSDIVVQDLPANLRAIPLVYNSCVGGAVSEEAYEAGLRAAGLVEVEVTARKIYDADAIGSLLEDELASLSCCVPREIVEAGITSVAGKVWSARFAAMRPRP